MAKHRLERIPPLLELTVHVSSVTVWGSWGGWSSSGGWEEKVKEGASPVVGGSDERG